MKIFISHSQDIPSLILHQEFELYINGLGRVNRLRKGWREEYNPLPILSSLTQDYLNLKDHIERIGEKDGISHDEESLRRNIESLEDNYWGDISVSNYDETSGKEYDYVINTPDGNIFLEVVNNNTTFNHIISGQVQEFCKLRHPNLLAMNPTRKRSTFNLEEWEVDRMGIIFFTTMFYNEEASFNEDLVSRYERVVVDSYSNPLANVSQSNFNFVLANRYKRCVENLSIKTLIVSRRLNDDSKLSGELNELPQISLAFMLQSNQEPSITDMAWLELFFACLNRMPIGLCQFCGSVYRLDGVNARGRYGKSTCGEDECKKKNRIQREKTKRVLDVEGQRAQVRERQRVHRLKKEFLKIFQDRGSSTAQAIEELVYRFALSYELDIDKVRSWVPLSYDD